MPKRRTRADTRHLYQRGGVWWLRYRDVRRSLYTADLGTAQATRDAAIVAIDRERNGVPRHGWRDAVGRWALEIGSQGLAPATFRRYRDSLRIVEPVLGPLFLDQIGRRELAAIAGRRQRSQASHLGHPVTNATRKRDLTAVGAVLKAAVAWGWLDRDPLLDFDRRILRERRLPPVLPTPAEVERYALGCPGPTLPHLVRLLYRTGLRLEEAASLQWPQVDRARATITLYATKTRKARAIALSPAALAVLAAIPRHIGCPYLFWHETPDGRAQRYRHLAEHLLKVRRRLGIAWRSHDLRHLFAVEYLQEPGASIYLLQAQLGHTTIAMTEWYLQFLTAEEQHRAKGVA